MREFVHFVDHITRFARSIRRITVPSLYCPYKEYYVIRIITLNRRYLYLRLEKTNTSTIDANIYLNCCFLAKYLTKIRIPFALLHLLLFNSLC